VTCAAPRQLVAKTLGKLAEATRHIDNPLFPLYLAEVLLGESMVRICLLSDVADERHSCFLPVAIARIITSSTPFGVIAGETMHSLMKSLFALLVLSILVAGCRNDTSTITGTLLGADGKPMPLAHVHVTASTYDPVTLPRQPDPVYVTEQVNADGTFRITTRETGPLFLFCTGVGHEDQMIPLPLDQPTDLTVAVNLARAYVDTAASEIQILTSVDKWATKQRGSLERQSDGSFRADIAATIDTMEYTVYASGPTRVVSTLIGISADRFQFDSQNEYHACVATHGGHAIIEYRMPKQAPGEEAHVRFADERSTVSRFYGLYEANVRYQADANQALRTHLLSGQPRRSFTYSWLPRADSLARIAQNTSDRLLRDELLLEVLECYQWGTGSISEHQVQATAGAVEPTSLAWAYHESLPLAVRSVSDQGRAYVESMIDRYPSRPYAAYVLFRECAEAGRTHDDAAMAAILTRLRRDFANTSSAQRAEMFYAPPSRITCGAILPRFAFRSAEDSTTVFTNMTFHRKPLLMVYWSTWCAPCVAEMPQLHKVHEKYAAAGLQMLSVTLSVGPEEVANFRRYRWPMPWSVAMAPKVRREGADTTLIAGTGMHILVDRDGKVLMYGGLEMARLDSILGHLFAAGHQ
jgi:thiol-disulfide isomerase/thioredoxin